jgi:hypothetical protein
MFYRNHEVILSGSEIVILILSSIPVLSIQWFLTRVPQRGVRGAAKFEITAFYLMFYNIKCHKLSFLTKLGCRESFLKTWRVPRTIINRLKNPDLITEIILFQLKSVAQKIRIVLPRRPACPRSASTRAPCPSLAASTPSAPCSIHFPSGRWLAHVFKDTRGTLQWNAHQVKASLKHTWRH